MRCTSSRNNHTKERCWPILHQDHEVALSVLDEFDHAFASSRGLATPGSRLESAIWRLDDFLSEKLPRHIRQEDEVLFPALERRLGPGLGPVAVMLSEHRALERLTTDLRLQARNARLGDRLALKECASVGDQVARLLREHIEKEENVLFPLALESLGEEERADVLRRMDAIEG
jgi:hemerythrin-like domain-containing protein